MIEPKPAEIFTPMRQLLALNNDLSIGVNSSFQFPGEPNSAPSLNGSHVNHRGYLQASTTGGADRSEQSSRLRSSPDPREIRRARTARRAAPTGSADHRATRYRERDRPGGRSASTRPG